MCLDSTPKDINDGETINECIFGYTYEVFNDEYGITNQKYILSSCLEFEDNITKFAKNDNGIYDNKFEK